MNLDKKMLVNIIVYIAMGIFVVLFIVSIFIGNNDTSEEEQEEQEESTGGVHQYSPGDEDEDNDSSPTYEELEEGEIWEEHEEIYEIEEEEVDESELAPSFEELYEEEDIKVTKEIVENFVEIIYEVDGDDPMKHIEDSKKYMTEDLYERLQDDYEQGQMTWTYGVKQKFESSDIYEPATTRVNDGIVWAVSVVGTIQYHDGEENEKTDIYLIHLKEINDEFKVEDYYINVAT